MLEQSFLLELSDAVRPLDDPIEVEGVSTRLLGERLGASRAYYVEYDADTGVSTVARDYVADGSPSLVGRYPREAYRTVMERISDGRTWIVEDVTVDEDLALQERELLASQGVMAWVDVPLVKRGQLVAVLCVVQGAPRRWTEADVALVEAVAERTWAAVERARAEEALRASEEKYRSLFQTMRQGYSLSEMIRDRSGRAVDFIMLELNPAYEQLIGLPVAHVRGRRAYDVFPNLEDWWIETYDRVLRDGHPRRLTHEFKEVGRWYEIQVYPAGGDRFVVLFDDITERKRSEQERERAEAALRESEERQGFLLKLSDAMRPLDDPIEVQGVATRLLGEHLGASRVYYVENDVAAGVVTVGQDYVADDSPSVVGRHDRETWRTVLEHFGDGSTWIATDVISDEKVAIEERELLAGWEAIAWVIVPLVKQGQLVALFCVVQSTPHLWSEADVALVEGVAERTWAAVERAQAEAALRRSEGRLRTLFESIDEGFSEMQVILDEKGNVVDWLHLALNGNFSRVTGIPDITGRLASEVFPSLEGEWFRRMDLAYRTGEPQRFETELAELGRWFDSYITRVDGEDGDRMLGVFGDITERKRSEQVRERAEAALRESEANFRSVANVVPDLLWYSEPDGSTTWFNERWMEYTGQTLEQAIGWGWVDAIHPADREQSARRYREAVEGSAPVQQEHRIRRHDGEYCWFLVRAQPLMDENGRLIRWYGAATNVDEARRAREELEARVAERTSQLAAALESVRSSEERLRLLLQQVPAMLWATDLELRVTTLMGADIPVVTAPADGRTVDDLFADVEANGMATLHRQVLGGAPAEFEFHIDSHTYEAHLEPLHDAAGHTIGTIGVAHDVTERTLRRLQESFIASVSHELQTPLTSIRSGLGLLDTAIGDTLGPAERELLSVSRRNTERLRLEIGQLLAATQLAARGPKIDRSPIDLHAVVDEAIQSLQILAQEKDQTLRVDMADRLEAEGDRRLLDQVLANLLSNAHRHTPPGTSITVSGWFVDNDVRLAVHDTGPGIPSDQLEAIFQRFYRSPGSRREGIGLGLAITRDAVDAQGGRVWAESVPGQGTTFFVSLPRARGTGST